MQRRLAALLPILALVLAACGAGDTPDDYFPLTPGRQWQYRVERTTMDGTRALRHAVRTLGVPPGMEVSGVRETLSGQRLLYVHDDGAIARLKTTRDARGTDIAHRVTVLPARLAPGTRWQSRSETSVLENTGPPWETLFRISVPLVLDYEVAAVDASVDTPAGRFDDCVLVTAHGSTSADVGNYIGRTAIEVNTREWYARDVGLVRLEREETTGATALSGGRLVMELDTWSDD